MNTKTILIALIALLVGLGGGYIFADADPMDADEHMMSGGMMMHNTDMGMGSAMDGMTGALQGKTGDELDEAFIDGMILHHEGAVAMARMLLAGTKRPELIQLGNDIISAQTAEIEMMRSWRAQWFNR